MDEWRGVILFSFSAAKLSSKAKLVFERRRIADSLVNSWRDKRPRRERTGLAFVPSFNRAIYSRDPCKIFTPPPTGILLRYFFPEDGPISLLLFRFCPLPFHYFGPCFLLFESPRWARRYFSLEGFPRKIRFAFISRYLAGTRWNFCRRGRYLVEGRGIRGSSEAGISSIFVRSAVFVRVVEGSRKWQFSQFGQWLLEFFNNLDSLMKYYSTRR